MSLRGHQTLEKSDFGENNLVLDHFCTELQISELTKSCNTKRVSINFRFFSAFSLLVQLNS